MASESVSLPIPRFSGRNTVAGLASVGVQSSLAMIPTSPAAHNRDQAGVQAANPAVTQDRAEAERLQRQAARMVDRAPEMQLIREAQAGSRAAFDSLIRTYEQQVLRLALHLTGSESDAEDIYQEAFLKAYRYLGNFRFECSFYTWIYRIVTNLCLDQLRRKKTRREDFATLIDQSGEEIDRLASVSDDRSYANPARELDRKQLSIKIQSALSNLTPRERTVFELKHYQGLRLRTIGEMLNTTEETAKNTLFRATKKLRAQLAEAR
jgi:RNA polymerase sigma-70 factor, ECF subfamily